MTKELNLSYAEVVGRLGRIISLPLGYAFEYGITCSGTQAPCIYVRIDGFEYNLTPCLLPFEGWLDSDDDSKVLSFLQRVEGHCEKIIELYNRYYGGKDVEAAKKDGPNPDLPF